MTVYETVTAPDPADKLNELEAANVTNVTVVAVLPVTEQYPDGRILIRYQPYTKPATKRTR
jgi:hypothetical protein